MPRPADPAVFFIRFCRRYGAPAVGLVWLISCWVPVQAAEREAVRGVDDHWRRYESPHFELFSHNSDEASRRVLHNLELLHAAFFNTLHLQEQRPVEVTIYYFESMRDFRAYTPAEFRKNANIAGFYMNRPDRAVIVISPQDDEEESQRIIFHEYVHHLTMVAGQTPALWFMEGIAELFSTIEEDSDGLILGKPIDGHVVELQSRELMPLEALFAVDHTSPDYHETSHAGLFYAESWGLLHYWLFGHSGLPRDQLGRFLDYIGRETEHGDPERRRALFQQATGMDYPAMAQRLDLYMKSGKYGQSKLPLPDIAPAGSYAVRGVPRDEIRGRLTELDLRVNHSAAAKLALLNRLDKNPDDIRALEMLGCDALMEGDEDSARERWEQALDAGTRNPAIFHELATMENRELFTQFDLLYFRLPAEKAEHLRMLLGRSIECAPYQTQAYEMLAWVEATAEKPIIGNVNLVQAHYSALPDKNHTAVALALVRIRLKDVAGARHLLDGLEANHPGSDVLRMIALLRDYLKKQDRASAPAEAP
jgi:hypothetical protein